MSLSSYSPHFLCPSHPFPLTSCVPLNLFPSLPVSLSSYSPHFLCPSHPIPLTSRVPHPIPYTSCVPHLILLSLVSSPVSLSSHSPLIFLCPSSCSSHFLCPSLPIPLSSPLTSCVPLILFPSLPVPHLILLTSCVLLFLSPSLLVFLSSNYPHFLCSTSCPSFDSPLHSTHEVPYSFSLSCALLLSLAALLSHLLLLALLLIFPSTVFEEVTELNP